MDQFIKITLPIENNLFCILYSTTHFEKTGKGRLGNHLLKIENDKIPIVRTTTQYNIPPQSFTPIHEDIIKILNKEIGNISTFSKLNLEFNNGLIEVYDKTYSKMGFHSDQGLDLEDDSYIALYSCYENPDVLTELNTRKLIVKQKNSDTEYEIALTHNSLVLFSVKTNSRYLHKIIGDSNSVISKTDNKWLGITFRKSKTFIQFKNNLPYFSNGDLLVIASEEQKKDFFNLRGQENREIDFIYPHLTYTISPSDILKPHY